jgi:deazaflavin-dependent oxidoreductase (nitroreductase family)
VPVTLPRTVYQAIGNVLTHPRFHPIHRRLYRWTGGRGPMSRALGMDMLLVTMRGARTGAPRTVPLGAVPDGDAWILIASNAGKDRMPAWVHNLRADGAVDVEHRGKRRGYRAHEAHGTERDRLWALVTAAYPGYDVYRQRTERLIPLFVLTPTGDA